MYGCAFECLNRVFALLRAHEYMHIYLDIYMHASVHMCTHLSGCVRSFVSVMGPQ